MEFTRVMPSDQRAADPRILTKVAPQKAELNKTEAALDKDAPIAYGALKLGLDFIPFARYSLPSNREEFSQMEPHDKFSAIAIEAIGLGIWAGIGPALRATKKGLQWAGKASGAIPKKLPVEDALKGIESLTQKGYKFKTFSYESSVKKVLSNKKLANDEIEAVFETLSTGNRGALKNAQALRFFKGKKPSERKPTAGWNEIVERTHEPYGGWKIKDEYLSKLAESTQRHNHYSKQFKEALEREIFRAKQKGGGLIDGAFSYQAKRFFGRPMSYAELSTEDAAQMIYDMLAHPKNIRRLARPGRGTWPALLSPTRSVFGSGEAAFGMISKVYKPITKAHGRVNEYFFSRILTWQKMLEQRGLGKLTIKETGEFKFKPFYEAKHETEAYNVIVKIDELMSRIPKGTRKDSQRLMQEIKSEIESVSASIKDSPAREIVEAWNEFADTLYGEYMSHQIRNIFSRAGLTEYGQRALDATMMKMEPEIARLFSTYASKNHTEKIKGIDKILKELRSKLELGEDVAIHPWFDKEGKQLQNTIKKLNNQLTRGNQSNQFMNYSPGYAARLNQRGDSLLDDWSRSISQNPRAFFTKARKQKVRTGVPVDFSTMIEARVRAQGKELFMYNELEAVLKHLDNTPVLWKEYAEHFLNRALGRPSIHDFKVARWIEDSLPGQKGRWDERRVASIAKTVNDLTYLGGIGFKPFSALRNLFQSLITVPADLGGVKDYWHLVRGVRRGFQPETKKYLQEIGAIGDYLPELSMQPRALPYGKRVSWRGKEVALPRLDSLRDVGLWMFRGSDRWSRYVTGGAALNKWDAAIRKTGRIHAGNLKSFMKRAGANGREDYVKAELQDLLARGRIEEARRIFVKDVIADTQFLYGSLDTPIITSKFGSVGKTGLIFQTWWMNYGSLISKWLTTGTVEQKAQRAITGYLSGAIAYTIMEKLWGKGSAQRATLLGPFPTEVNEFLIPPAWTPIYRALRVSVAAATLDKETAFKQTKALLESVPVLVPGGLQIKSFARGAQEEGMEGLMKALINYRGSGD